MKGNNIEPNGRSHVASISEQPSVVMAVEAPQDEHIISVRDPLQIIWRWSWVIVLVGVMFAGATVWYDSQQPPTYQTSTKLLVGQDLSDISDLSNLQGEVQGLQALTKTMTSAVNTRPVAEAAIKQLGFPMTPETLIGNLSARQVPDTQFIDVSYKDSDPKRAQQIANTVGDTFSKLIAGQLNPNSNLDVRVWEKATLPVSPVAPSTNRDGALAFGLGCMLGVGLAFLLERLSGRLRSPEEIEQISGLPALGVIPRT